MRAEHAARSAATPKARDAAHPQEQRSCGTESDRRCPPQAFARRIETRMGRNRVRVRGEAWSRVATRRAKYLSISQTI